MKKDIFLKCLLVGVVGSACALADMAVDKSNGVLTVTSDISGTVIAKVVGPNDEIIVNDTYEGNSFSWTPSGTDGAYRFDVRVEGDYVGGIIEIVKAEIQTNNGENEGGIL